MEDFAFDILEALNANQQLDMLHDLGAEVRPRSGQRRARCRSLPELGGDQQRGLHAHRWFRTSSGLGLITERTEPRYRKLGILSDTRTAPRSKLPLSA